MYKADLHEKNQHNPCKRRKSSKLKMVNTINIDNKHRKEEEISLQKKKI